MYFQWLPLIKVSTIERIFIKILRFLAQKTKFLLTIHNVYPHDSSEGYKQVYRERFSRVSPFFDKFIIIYGNQSTYKGTDVFVNAMTLLPQEYKDNVHALVVGKTYSNYLKELKEKKEKANIEFIPESVSDEDLYKDIADSDIIVLPYREISQSGVLLLALSTKRVADKLAKNIEDWATRYSRRL